MADSTDPAELYSVLWQGGRRPDLDAFVASAGALTPRQLADLVCTDQRERWRAGDRVPVESYFERFPQLRSDPSLALDLVHAEVLLQGAADPTSVADLSRRFPDLAAPLRGQADRHRTLTPAPPSATDDRPLPPRFGRYEIRRVLGRGGMGTVYLARDTQLDRLVALKVPMLDNDPGRVRLFVREAQAAAALRHPHICPVYDAGEIDGRPFLTMAYLEGEPLSDRVRRGPLPVAEAVRLVRTMAAAMEEAHRAGIVHRDLKPSNVLLDGQGRPVIADFGLARNLTAADSRSGQAMVGTPNYMAPEQANGTAGSGGPAVDVYALGVVLYELLTGARPFDGPLGTVLARITTDDPEPPSRRRPEVDARLSAVCLKALARDPADRFASMAAFAAALDDWLAGRAPPGPARRPWWLLIGSGVAAVLLLVVGLLAWHPWARPIPASTRQPDSPGPPPVARDGAGAEARAELAWRLNGDGELDRAVEESTAALAIDDRCVSALLCRANARIKKGEARLALPDLTRAAETDPNNHEPEIDLAWAFNELGQNDEALKHADRAVHLRPDSAEAHCQRGGAYKQLEMYQEAVRDLTEAIRLKPEYELAYRERAEAYEELGEGDLARQDEKKADDLARRPPKP